MIREETEFSTQEIDRITDIIGPESPRLVRMCRTCNGTIWTSTEFPDKPNRLQVIIVRTYLFLVETQVLNQTIGLEALSALYRILEYTEVYHEISVHKLKGSLVDLRKDSSNGIKAEDMSKTLEDLIIVFERLFLDLAEKRIIQPYTQEALRQLKGEIQKQDILH